MLFPWNVTEAKYRNKPFIFLDSMKIKPIAVHKSHGRILFDLKKNIWQAGHRSSCLQSEYLEDGGKRILGLGSAWAI